ncbi:exonuclease domain-containing protein [Sinomicrobium soli]|uniref:exonuclease domain-containing protein n=1 Tax=Sinomicrobium sp. N-1-3-6 TaxID=2219864 RepID=UPI000DCD287B|nr:exonuclease domain-containing protein [Sinomicrobium sp. N-1-3-6]RAV28392.1 DNA polymerase III subunit epsilon [Sinomicrobium sp. N-1-3-6]
MYAIVDVETTGLGGDHNRITEIAIAIHDGKRVVEEFHSLVNPGIPISPYVTGLTGIDNDMVMNSPAFADLADTIEQYTKDRIFIAHNAGFDYHIIRKEFQRAGMEFRRKKLCTVKLSRHIFPGLRSYSLGKLCSHLGIAIRDRHRAKGDTDATVILFEKLLQHDHEDIISKQLHPRSGESALPSLLPREVFDRLPETPGIYYFMDQKDHIIYVGKAINIKKRVLGHFYDKKAKEIAMSSETARIDFEETGSELLALIREAAEIKKHYPRYNTAQKRSPKAFGIISYTDRSGIIHLGYSPLKQVRQPLKVFYSVTGCIAFLEALCEKFDLCPRFTQLQSNSQTCSHYRIRNCPGICRGEEAPEAYNKRVLQSVRAIRDSGKNFMIVEKGRTSDEKALIEIRDDHYSGHGFIPADQSVLHYGELQHFITARQHYPDIQQIIGTYLDRGKNRNIIPEKKV